MTLTYSGQMKEKKFNTRTAWLKFEEGTNEEVLAERIIDLMEKVTGWTAEGFDGFYTILVDDKEDFKELMHWYKEVRKMFEKCMKYGF